MAINYDNVKDEVVGTYEESVAAFYYDKNKKLTDSEKSRRSMLEISEMRRKEAAEKARKHR